MTSRSEKQELGFQGRAAAAATKQREDQEAVEQARYMHLNMSLKPLQTGNVGEAE